MALEKSKIVPTAFWVGFLALGFVTSLGAPAKHRVDHLSRAPKAVAVPENIFAQSERPAKFEFRSAAQD